MSAHAGGVLELPRDEQARLRAVRRYDILDSPPDGAFDRVASLAAWFFDVPIATVTIVDEDRIWFKATHGIDVTEVGRDPGLCASAILRPDPYVVANAIDDPRCFENPLVRGELGVRFYAAAPIRTPDGHNLGTVNVIAGEPRTVTEEELAVLQELADIVADELEVRLAARRTVAAERAQRRRAEQLTDFLQRRLLPQRPAAIPGLDVATYYQPASPELDIGGDFIDVFDIAADHWALAIGDVCGKGPEAAAATGDIRSALRATTRLQPRPGAALAHLNDALYRDGLGVGDAAAASELFCTAALVCLERTASGFTATVANAGHPLALLRRADGRVENFGIPGQLLGQLPALDVTEATTELAPGDLLLLYTDGAVEQRGLSMEVGEQALRRALASAPDADAATALAHVHAALESLHETYHDDIALTLVRVPTA